MRPQKNSGYFLLVSTLTTGLTACGLNQQDPSFKEERTTVSIALTVDDSEGGGEDGAATSDETSQHLESMDANEVSDILDSLFSNESIGEGDAVGNEYIYDDEPTSTDNSSSDDGAGTLASNSGIGTGSEGSETIGESISSVPTGTGSTSNNTEGTGASIPETGWSKDVVAPSQAELKACAKLNGVSVDRVKVTGNKSSASLTSNTVVAIKLSGNQTYLDLNLAGRGSIAGMCIFVTGNQAIASVNTAVRLGNLIYIGRGNRSSGDIEVKASGEVSNIVADLRGNRASLSIHGEGIYNCNKANVIDKTGGFRCQ